MADSSRRMRLQRVTFCCLRRVESSGQFSLASSESYESDQRRVASLAANFCTDSS